MKHYEYETNLFLDGELNNDKQRELFAHLAECNSCMNALEEYQELKNENRNFYLNLDTPSFKPLHQTYTPAIKNKRNYTVPFYISAAACIILAFLLMIQIDKMDNESSIKSDLHKKLASLKNQYELLLSEKTDTIQPNIIAERIKSSVIESKSKVKSPNDSSTISEAKNIFNPFTQNAQIISERPVIEYAGNNSFPEPGEPVYSNNSLLQRAELQFINNEGKNEKFIASYYDQTAISRLADSISKEAKEDLIKKGKLADQEETSLILIDRFSQRNNYLKIPIDSLYKLYDDKYYIRDLLYRHYRDEYQYELLKSIKIKRE